MNNASRYLNDFVDITRVPGLICVAFSLGGLFNQYFWPSDLMCHFYVQYWIVLLVLLLAAGVARRWKLAGVFIVALTICTVVLTPSIFRERPKTSDHKSQLKIIQVNVNSANNDFQSFASYIKDCDADLICAEEVNSKWAAYFKTKLPNYRYQIINARADNFGIAILSRTPLSNPISKSFGSAGVPTLLAGISSESGQITVICTHPVPPTSFENFALRNEQLNEIANYIGGLRGGVILCGDLNTTPWSHVFSNLATKGNLLNTASGFGLQSTWPTNSFLLGIPIDHVLVSPNLGVLEHKVSGKVGSDHYPVFVRVALQ